jgi:hypothetical protein
MLLSNHVQMEDNSASLPKWLIDFNFSLFRIIIGWIVESNQFFFKQPKLSIKILTKCLIQAQFFEWNLID